TWTPTCGVCWSPCVNCCPSRRRLGDWEKGPALMPWNASASSASRGTGSRRSPRWWPDTLPNRTRRFTLLSESPSRGGIMKRVALISEHASPLAALGGVDSGGQNLYVGQLAQLLAARGLEVDVFTRKDACRLAETVPLGRARVIHVPAGPASFVPKEELLPFM